jgi:hypothetical protein
MLQMCRDECELLELFGKRWFIDRKALKISAILITDCQKCTQTHLSIKNKNDVLSLANVFFIDQIETRELICHVVRLYASIFVRL